MSLLRAVPRPLVDKKRRVIVLWSPKSACTTVYAWFSNLCGFLEEVRDFHSWPHEHRMKVFLKSERYRESVRADTSGFHVVKIIRDPYARAASIFRQAVATNFADRDAAAMGLDFDGGVSFREFLLLLTQLDMKRANAHYRPQWHPFERARRPDTVINISKTDLFGALNALEMRVGWPATNFASMGWLHALEGSRRPPKLISKKQRLFAEPIVRGRPPAKTPFPDYDALLVPKAKKLIERVYRVDFDAYRDYL